MATRLYKWRNQNRSKPVTEDTEQGQHYLVGGGIASLAAAVFLVRDAGVLGRHITIFEEFDRLGGSLDGSGDPTTGYLVRGGRMFEPNFVCTADLLSSIPMPEKLDRSLWEDILLFNQDVPGSSNCRLVRGGQPVGTDLGVSRTHIVELNQLLLKSEQQLQGETIGSCFSRDFFDSNFWIMWSTMFSFQPWHSAIEMRRYLRRFIHLFPGFTRIEGILRTRYNQYDSIIAPMAEWLRKRGVRIQTGARVTDVRLDRREGGLFASQLDIERKEPVKVEPQDRVYLTLGSMTDGSSTGSNTRAPARVSEKGACWSLWEKLAARHSCLGNPNTFAGQPSKSAWMSFTATMRSSAFFDYMEEFTGNRTGTGGLVTIADSSWFLSLVMFHQPHFRVQAEGHYVFWGYGLRGDRTGDYVQKPMSDCTGDEVLTELAEQLRLPDEVRNELSKATVRTCWMPFITSQFMPRSASDRAPVRPKDVSNFAVLGQFCELPRDTVFTVEYSVRSARQAVHELTGKTDTPPPVVRSDRDPGALFRAARTLLRG